MDLLIQVEFSRRYIIADHPTKSPAEIKQIYIDSVILEFKMLFGKNLIELDVKGLILED